MTHAGKAAWRAIRVITLGAYALQLALLPKLTAQLGLARQIGIVAACIGCLVPTPGSCYKWEAIFTGLALVIVAYLLKAAADRLPLFGAGSSAQGTCSFRTLYRLPLLSCETRFEVKV